MKKLILSLTILLMLFSPQAPAQNKVTKAIGCGVAVAQLLNYANQVKQFYNAEYYTIIPNNRCPAFDPWGRPLAHPVVVQNCRNQHLAMLNNWYAQQVNYVNAWQGQIATACLTEQPKKKRTPPVEDEETAKIDTEEIEELRVGVDEDRAVKITIPKTAEGYKPR